MLSIRLADNIFCEINISSSKMFTIKLSLENRVMIAEKLKKRKSTAEIKERQLRSLMRSFKSVLVAYSGGVDSAYLSLIATQELGENAYCYLGVSPSVSEAQHAQAGKIAMEFGFNFGMIETSELDDPKYYANPVNRCYFCKTELYGKLRELASERNIAVILDGANSDDLNDYRPGAKAANENDVRSVLAEFGFTKDEIRERSRFHNLETWDKPASPCLASRIQYGIPVSIERLSKVERGETILRGFGFVEFRVRHHDSLVRIEIAGNEMEKALDQSITKKLAEEFKNLGFKYVTLDLHGFRSGAMNEIIKKADLSNNIKVSSSNRGTNKNG